MSRILVLSLYANLVSGGLYSIEDTLFERNSPREEIYRIPLDSGRDIAEAQVDSTSSLFYPLTFTGLGLVGLLSLGRDRRF